MSFEYNGFIYRDLEPQVRYDAEQVQLLKQADVTINENLQTINESLQTVNTEINGKLTKPTNPSAESAVTMLADGTVGTKPFSEFGGKLYLHRLQLNAPDTGRLKNIYANMLIYSPTLISFDGQRPNGYIYGPANIRCQRKSDGKQFYGTTIIHSVGYLFDRNIITELYGPIVLLGSSDNSTNVFDITEVFKNVTFTDFVYEL